MSYRLKLYVCEDCGEQLNSSEIMQGDVCPECGGDCYDTGESVWVDDVDVTEYED